MRTTLLILLSAILLSAIVLGVAPARAEKHVFIIANNPDGYGIDRCLASGSSCGAAVAAAYCQSQEFVSVSSFRKVEHGEITSAAPANAGGCQGGSCEFVAIECTR
jgi:hypothetical protein